jgi:hypothetical protein
VETGAWAVPVLSLHPSQCPSSVLGETEAQRDEMTFLEATEPAVAELESSHELPWLWKNVGALKPDEGFWLVREPTPGHEQPTPDQAGPLGCCRDPEPAFSTQHKPPTDNSGLSNSFYNRW